MSRIDPKINSWWQKISAKECKKWVLKCKKRPIHLNTKKQPQSCCLFDFLLKFRRLNVPETYYSSQCPRNLLRRKSSVKRSLRNGQNYILINKKDNDFFIVLFIWAAVDSNHRPHPYQGCALTTWASSPRMLYQLMWEGILFDNSSRHFLIYHRHFFKSSLFYLFEKMFFLE